MDIKKYIYQKLEELNIEYSIINHEAIFSEKDTNLNNFAIDLTIGKNLFLRNDKKDKYYLVILPLTKRVNLQKLTNILNEKRLSFANENELDKYLKILPGSVSYLNVITAQKLGGNFEAVTYIIDKDIIDSKKIGFHPSDNTATIVTTSDSILKVFEEYNLRYSIIKL